MHALVTGVQRFLGSHLDEALLHDGWQVSGVDALFRCTIVFDIDGGAVRLEGGQVQYSECQPGGRLKTVQASPSGG